MASVTANAASTPLGGTGSAAQAGAMGSSGGTTPTGTVAAVSALTVPVEVATFPGDAELGGLDDFRPHTRGAHLTCSCGWRLPVLQSLSAARLLANRHWMDCEGCKPPKISPREYTLLLRKPEPETGRTIIGARRSGMSSG